MQASETEKPDAPGCLLGLGLLQKRSWCGQAVQLLRPQVGRTGRKGGHLHRQRILRWKCEPGWIPKMMRLVRQGNVSKVMVYKLNPILSEAEQVRYLFEGYAREAVSLRRLVDVLNTKGKLPLDSSHWTTAKISNLLKNHFCESRLQRVRLFRPAWNENRHKYVPVHRRMGYSTLWPHQTPTRQSGLVRCAAGPIEPPRDCGFRHLAQMSA